MKNTQKHTNSGILQPVNQRESRYARLTWNTNDWISPSGRAGKSTNKNTYEYKYGFGHEEWLLDLDKIIDGYHYSFLEPVNRQYNNYQGRYFDVWLYTIDGETKNRYWIGRIKDLYVLTEDEAKRSLIKYKENGWMDEMKVQLSGIEHAAERFSQYESQPYLLFNIRFRPELLFLNNPYVELSGDHPIQKLSRYNLSSCSGELQAQKNNQPFRFVPPPNNQALPVYENRTYTRQAREYEIKCLHNSISQSLVAKLRAKFGDNNVTAEHKMADNRKIDIVVNSLSGFIFYEIKTYPTLRISIREAIGQLLEYAFWPESSHSKKLIIVSHMKKDIETENYLKHIRKKFRIPIYYQSYNYETDTLSVLC